MALIPMIGPLGPAAAFVAHAQERRNVLRDEPYIGLKIGCPVCGYGADWSWPGFVAIKTGTVLTCFITDWMLWEYLCVRCVDWARAAGAEWDGKLKFRFEGFSVSK